MSAAVRACLVKVRAQTLSFTKQALSSTLAI